ncbi:MAG: leucine-rich repeat protein [Lachnospiraceae bacterium]|nr:leucine-rich repeat protein [Lachnospiraceae bacterium]
MAEKKAKNTDAGKNKEKKGMSPSTKRVLRQSVAGVCLVSSLLIAAIPTDRSGNAEASVKEDASTVFDAINMLNGVQTNGTSYTDSDKIMNTGLAFDKEGVITPVEEDPNAPDLGLAIPNQTTTTDTSWSLFVDSNNYIQTLYKYYEAPSKSGSQYLGVICDHNRDIGASISTMNVYNTICANYEFYSDTDFITYMDSMYKSFKFVVFDPTKEAYIIMPSEVPTDANTTSTTTDAEGKHIVGTDEMEILFPGYSTNREEYLRKKSEYEADPDTLAYYGVDAPLDFSEMKILGWPEYKVFDGATELAEQGMLFVRKHMPTSTFASAIPFEYLTLTEAKPVSGIEIDSDDSKKLRYTNVSGHNAGDPVSGKSGWTYAAMPAGFYIITDKRAQADRGDNWPNYMDEAGRIYRKTQRITCIGEQAFKGNTHLNSITLDKEILYVGNNAFEGDIELSTATLEGVTFIGSEVFYKCPKLSTINLYGNVQTIGNKAFAECTALASVKFPDSVKEIGYGAFADCSSLVDISISSNVVCSIGDYAFYNTQSLQRADFSKAEKDISLGKACFAMERPSGDALVEFVFPKRLAKGKKVYTLYGADVDLFDAAAKVMGAKNSPNGTTIPSEVDTTNQSAVTALASACEYESILGDFLLANRMSLKNVYVDVLGRGSVERLPMNTFMGCANLENVILQDETSTVGKESMLALDANIFRDVNSDVVVIGPRNANKGSTGREEPNRSQDYAMPRMSTWGCYTSVKDSVPYCYKDGDVLHYEVSETMESGGKKHSLLFDLDTGVGGADEAAVQTCTYLGKLTTADELGTREDPFRIPAEVAGFQVVELLPKSLDNVKDNICYLSVSDNGLKRLGDKVFEGCAKLKGVTLGDSVASIGEATFQSCGVLESVTIGTGIANVGEAAFKYCTKLEDVYWEAPADAGADWLNIGRNIGKDAFYTEADGATGKLYFHGLADSESYAPFRYAMTETNKINGSGVNICYMTPVKSDEWNKELWPTLVDAGEFDNHERFQTMSMIANDGMVTLIDYPRFQELPHCIREVLKTGAFKSLSPAEQDLVTATRSVTIPSVVESIDVELFISDGSKNTRYIDNADKTKYGVTKQEMYLGKDPSAKNTHGLFAIEAYAAGDSREGGLFSGSYPYHTDEEAAIRNLKMLDGDSTFTHKNERGNDWVVQLSFGGVKEIPDHAFDGCERLWQLNLGAKCEYVGEYAFKDCVNLSSLATDSVDESGMLVENPNYAAENLILYHHLSDGHEEIVACMPSRGLENENLGFSSALREVGTNYGDVTYMNNVSKINPDAFRDCEWLRKVDLSDTSINLIPEKGFEGCTVLKDVRLPDQLVNVQDGAFLGCASGLVLKVPNMNSTVQPTAFDAYDKDEKNEYYIQTPMGSTAYSITVEAGSKYKHIHWLKMGRISVLFYKDYANKVLYDDSPLSKQDYELTEEKPFVNVDAPDTSADADFECWCCSIDGKTVEGDSVLYNITDTREIWAKYKKTQPTVHTVKFLYDDGFTLIRTHLVTDGEVLPGVPSESGLKTKAHPGEEDKWVFDHWRPTVDGVEVTFDLNSSPVTSDMSIFTVFRSSSSSSPSGNTASENTPTPTPGGGNGNGDSGTTPTPTPGSGNGGSSSTPTPTTAGGGNGNGNGGSSTSNNSSYEGKMYYAIVENGSGSGSYPAGSVVTITAYAPPDGKTFDRWTTSNTDIGISNVQAISTTLVMPSHDVKVTATYRSIATSGNTARPVTVTDNTGTVYVTPTPIPGGNNGTEVRITTDTIDNNKKNLGTASVAGSTDNFVVKVTDSAAATAAVEAALRASYGDRFQDLRYAAFDISLYDSTGTYLVSNANDLAVTITLPIPEALVSYGGNNKAGAVINGQLQELAVQYTTIDGVPCMRFTATHFSPYTIFVDTKNVVRGITDNTPKTGDGIAPKWFLSAGMLSLSCVLFLWKDKKYPVLAEEKKKA